MIRFLSGAYDRIVKTNSILRRDYAIDHLHSIRVHILTILSYKTYTLRIF